MHLSQASWFDRFFASHVIEKKHQPSRKQCDPIEAITTIGHHRDPGEDQKTAEVQWVARKTIGTRCDQQLGLE
jgi:hypothetical protein